MFLIKISSVCMNYTDHNHIFNSWDTLVLSMSLLKIPLSYKILVTGFQMTNPCDHECLLHIYLFFLIKYRIFLHLIVLTFEISDIMMHILLCLLNYDMKASVLLDTLRKPSLRRCGTTTILILKLCSITLIIGINLSDESREIKK